MVRYLAVILIAASWFATADAQERSPLMPVPNSLFVRFVDTGPGLATIAVVTGATASQRKVMIFDAGHWDADNVMIAELRHYLSRRRTIDVLVISHADSDHLGTADSILTYWNVKKAVRNGWIRPTSANTYDAYMEALARSVDENGTEDLAMGDGSPAIGETWNLGEARLTFLAGFADVPEDWDVGGTGNAKRQNAVSVVARLDYAGKSILFTGDAVGRRDNGPDDHVLATEKFLMEHDSGDRRLRADIIQVPHHGADNASALPFIRAVAPEFAIFTAGFAHEHPRASTYARYEAAGLAPEKLFRTDIGEVTGPKEQPGTWDESCEDAIGDDGVSVLIKSNGSLTIEQDPLDDEQSGC